MNTDELEPKSAGRPPARTACLPPDSTGLAARRSTRSRPDSRGILAHEMKIDVYTAPFDRAPLQCNRCKWVSPMDARRRPSRGMASA